MENKLQVLYVDTLENINHFLNTVTREGRHDLTVFTASNKDEVLKIVTQQKKIKVVILTKAVYKNKRIIGDMKCFLTNSPEFLGVSSSPEIRECLGSMGCNLVFDNKDEIIHHIPKKHPDTDGQADQ
ncbi:MAG: hypothetical protein WC229_02150 [Candidatus Paceibacterota bacterium]|jgi:hypothetical protein